MEDFKTKEYKIFEMFEKDWALVTAGNEEKFNACTVGWGSLGTLWTRPGHSAATATVYLHPARYTCEVLRGSEYFTVSFFDEEYRKALAVMGSRSGRDGDKCAEAGLTPVAFGGGVSYREAKLTLVCRKLYQHSFAKDELAEEISQYYQRNPRVYPADENGEWQPHWVFVGEIVEAVE